MCVRIPHFLVQGCQKVFSSRLIMNSRRLWNSNQRHKFLRAEASRGILKFRVLEIAFGGFQEVFSTADTMLFCRNTHKTQGTMLQLPKYCMSNWKFPINLWEWRLLFSWSDKVESAKSGITLRFMSDKNDVVWSAQSSVKAIKSTLEVRLLQLLKPSLRFSLY